MDFENDKISMIGVKSLLQRYEQRVNLSRVICLMFIVVWPIQSIGWEINLQRGWNNSVEKNLSIVGLYISLSENGRGARNEYVDSGGTEYRMTRGSHGGNR